MEERHPISNIINKKSNVKMQAINKSMRFHTIINNNNHHNKKKMVCIRNADSKPFFLNWVPAFVISCSCDHTFNKFPGTSQSTANFNITNYFKKERKKES